ncbi:MAG: hypothetical protein P8184_14405 [Calditrichia bacterium]
MDNGHVRVEIFRQGRLLYSEHYNYERRTLDKDATAEMRIRPVLESYHQEIISSLETLFELSGIIYKEEHYLSHFRLGSIFLSLHIYDKAEEHILKSIDLNTKFYSAYIALARCYFFQKQYSRASQTLEPLVREQLSYPDMFNLLGMILLEQKDYVHALNQLRFAIKLNPNYLEAYFNLLIGLVQRILILRTQDKNTEIQKNSDFLNILLKKIYKIGEAEEHLLLQKARQALIKQNYSKIYSLVYDHRNKYFFQRAAPEIAGYEFELWFRYLPERLNTEMLQYFENKLSLTLDNNPNYPDIWNYLAMIHLMLCRDDFLKGMEFFREATKMNPKFAKARKNLRLVENDGREFLSLIKAMIR